MSKIEFQILNSTNIFQPYYWNIVVKSNGAILASSETYVKKADAINAINIVYQEAASAEYVDKTN